MSQHRYFDIGTLGTLRNIDEFTPQNFGAFSLPKIPDRFTSNNPGFSISPEQFNPSSFNRSDIGFGENNTPQFGVNGPGFGNSGELFAGGETGSNFTTLQGAQLGIGALNTGSAIFDSINRRKQLKLARDAFNFEKEAFNKNFGLSQASFDNQVTTVNNRIGDQNAFKIAQGRTDLSKLVV